MFLVWCRIQGASRVLTESRIAGATLNLLGSVAVISNRLLPLGECGRKDQIALCPSPEIPRADIGIVGEEIALIESDVGGDLRTGIRRGGPVVAEH